MTTIPREALGFDELMVRARDAIEALEALGQQAAADEHALLVYVEQVKNLALELGQDRLGRALAREAGEKSGAIDDAQLVAGNPRSDGRLARELGIIALQLSKAALPGKSADLLSGALKRKGSGSKRPTIFEHAVPAYVHGDPLAQHHWVMLVRCAGFALRQSALGKFGDSVRRDARTRLVSLGFKENGNVPSREKIELAIIEQAGGSFNEKRWDRVRTALDEPTAEAIKTFEGLVTRSLDPKMGDPTLCETMSHIRSFLRLDTIPQLKYISGLIRNSSSKHPA